MPLLTYFSQTFLQIGALSGQEGFQCFAVFTFVSTIMPHIKWESNAYLLHTPFGVCTSGYVYRNRFFREALRFIFVKKSETEGTLRRLSVPTLVPSPSFTLICRGQIQFPHGGISTLDFNETCLER